MGLVDRLGSYLRRGYRFPTQDHEARVSDVALGLNFPASGDYDPRRDRAAEEPVDQEKAVEAFFQFLTLQDIRHEVTPYTALPGDEGDRRRLEFAKQSQESDDEGMSPAPFC